jgi:hypothetical protein
MMKKFGKYLSFLALVTITVIFFHKFFFQGLLPIPTDIITGVYYPWLDHKWGNVVGVAVKNPLMSDIPSLIYPWRTLAVDLMKNFQWPLWNQYSFSGYPLLGNWQSAPFSPANLFYALSAIPPIAKGRLGGIELGWTFGVIFQPLLAAFFMYLWLRNKKLKQIPSILSGFLYAFSGFHITWIYYNTHAWTTLWLPLILLSIDKILINKKTLNQNKQTNFKLLITYSLFTNPYFLLLSLTIALSILSGYPIILIYETIIIVTYLISTRYYLFPITYFLLPISIILGLGLSAIQWFPGLETINQSIHSLDTSTLQSANQGFLPIQNLITILAPDFFGNPATYNYWGIGHYDNWVFYISIGGLMLAILAFLTKPPPYYLLFITLLGIILSTNNPVGNTITNLIPLLKNSIHSRALFLFDFGIAIAAAYGLQTLLTIHLSKLKTPIIITIIITAIFFILIWANLLNDNFLNIPNLNENRPTAFRNLILPGVFLISTSALLLIPTFVRHSLFTVRYSRYSIPYLLFLILVTLDLLRFGWKYLPFTPSQYLYPSTEIIDWLINQKNNSPEPFRIEFGEVIPENMWIPYRLESPAGYDALMPLRYGQFLEAIQSGQLNNTTSRFPKIENLNSHLFSLTNSKYILALKYNDKWERSPEGTQLKDIYNQNFLTPVYETGTVVVLENLHYLPRAFVVSNAEVVQDDRQLISILTDPSTDFLQTVFLDKGAFLLPTNYLPHRNHAKAGQLPNYNITWHQTTGSQRKLTVTTDRPGYLVLLESYNPNWKATIANEKRLRKTNQSNKAYLVIKTKLFRANFTFMALRVNQGTNQITLTYYPDSFKYGLWTTIISLLIWISIAIIATKRHQQYKEG